MRDYARSLAAFWKTPWRRVAIIIGFCLGSLPSWPGAIKTALHLPENPPLVDAMTSTILNYLAVIGVLALLWGLFDAFHVQRMKYQSLEEILKSLQQRGVLSPLEPRQRMLLRNIYKQQEILGGWKITITEMGVSTPTNFNVTAEMLGVDKEELRRLIRTMPPEYMTQFIEFRSDNAYVVWVTPAGYEASRE